LKWGSTAVSSRCSCQKARSETCTRARCGPLSDPRGPLRLLIAPLSPPLSADEVEKRLLVVESVPLGSEDETDGRCSLSVDEEGPEDGSDLSRREWRRRSCSRRAPTIGIWRTAACRDRDTVGRAAQVAATVKADPFTARPPPRAVPPVASNQCARATVSPAHTDLE